MVLSLKISLTQPFPRQPTHPQAASLLDAGLPASYLSPSTTAASLTLQTSTSTCSVPANNNQHHHEHALDTNEYRDIHSPFNSSCGCDNTGLGQHSPMATAQLPLGMGLGRLYSLDSSVLHQLDRVLSGTGEQLQGGFSCSGHVPGIASSAPLPGGALGDLSGRIYKVRPLGAAASSLSLQSACALGSSLSRCNSTLLEMAEEQASLAAAHHLSSHIPDYRTLLSAGNSAGGGTGNGLMSCQSNAAGSLSVSPNNQQAHVSLASLLGAAAAGSSCFDKTSCTTAWQLQCSLPSKSGFVQTLSAPDMRFFPFSTPEDFYMAAAVLLDAKLPGTTLEEVETSPPTGDMSPCAQ